MPLWGPKDQANAAPKFYGVSAKEKAWSGQANIVTTGTFTQGSNVITSLGSLTGIAVNQIIVAPTLGPNVSPGAIVTAVNSTAVQMSQLFTGTTASGVTVNFDYNHITGYNLYNNTTPNAFQNNQAVGVFNMLNIPNYVTITANTIAGNNVLTNTFPTATSNGTLTNGSAVITALDPANPVTTGVIPGMLVAANSVGLTYPTYVTSVNSTAIVLSNTYTGTTATTRALNFVGGANSTYVYGNTTAGANVGASSNTVQLIANVTATLSTAGLLAISANNYGPTFKIGQTIQPAAGAGTEFPATIVGNTDATNWLLANSKGGSTFTSLTSTTFTTQSVVGISPGMQIYTAATSTLSNTNLAVANVIGTNVILSQNSTSTANATSAMVFTKMAVGLIAAGNNLPTLTTGSSTGTLTTNTTTITGTISNGTIGSNGNILNVTALSGPIPAVGQEILANSTIAVTNGVYISALGTAAGNSSGLGTYIVSVNSISNGASGIAVTLATVVPKVVYVNTSAILLTSNVYATNSAVGNTVTFSSYEQTLFGHSQHSGWTEIRYGSGPVVPANSTVNAVVNSTSTSGYANGETIVVSGGSANALLTITTNTGSTAGVGANIASVVITYPGGGFTNTGVLSYTYQRQQHIANVTVTGTTSGVAIGDTIALTATYQTANVTGYQNGSVLTITNNQTGTLAIGNLLKLGVATFTANTINGNNFLTNLSSNAGITVGQTLSGAGVQTGTVVNAVNATVVVMSSAATANATSATVTLSMANTQILSQLSGSAGGNGAYAVSSYQFIANSATPFNNFVTTGQIIAASANITAAGAVTNTNITVINQGLFTNGLTAANLILTYSNSSAVVATGTGTTVTALGGTFTGVYASASAGTPLNVTLGGRSGRQYVETLVPLTGTSPYVTENAADNATFPNS